MRRARTLSALLLALVRPVISLGLSGTLHAGALTPVLLYAWLHDQPLIDSPGEDGEEDGPVGNEGGEIPLGELAPMSVSLYVEPVAEAPPVAPAAEATPAAKTPTRAETDTKAASTDQGSPEGTAEAEPAPDAPVPGVKGRRPRGNRKPCEPIDEIVATGEARWRVERDVVDWYATHLKELEKQVGVATHTGADGKPDGARLYLPRCSILRQAGLKHADVVNTVNGMRVATIPDAIAAYFVLRNEELITVEITRKNGDKLTHRYRLRR